MSDPLHSELKQLFAISGLWVRNVMGAFSRCRHEILSDENEKAWRNGQALRCLKKEAVAAGGTAECKSIDRLDCASLPRRRAPADNAPSDRRPGR